MHKVEGGAELQVEGSSKYRWKDDLEFSGIFVKLKCKNTGDKDLEQRGKCA